MCRSLLLRFLKISGSVDVALPMNQRGFDPCDEFGEVVPAELGPWDGIVYGCTRCWRVIDRNTLEILRLTEVEVVEKNLEYRWSYLSE
jgi:hypothetical protein